MAQIHHRIFLQFIYLPRKSGLSLQVDLILLRSSQQFIIRRLRFIDCLPINKAFPNRISIIIVQKRFQCFQPCCISFWQSPIWHLNISSTILKSYFQYKQSDEHLLILAFHHFLSILAQFLFFSSGTLTASRNFLLCAK